MNVLSRFSRFSRLSALLLLVLGSAIRCGLPPSADASIGVAIADAVCEVADAIPDDQSLVTYHCSGPGGTLAVRVPASQRAAFEARNTVRVEVAGVRRIVRVTTVADAGRD